MKTDNSDYDTLVRPIEDQMIRSVWRIVCDPNNAEDAFQEAAATIWKRLDRIRRHPNPKALILKIRTDAAWDMCCVVESVINEDGNRKRLPQAFRTLLLPQHNFL